jgi:hypothetical protein
VEATSDVCRSYVRHYLNVVSNLKIPVALTMSQFMSTWFFNVPAPPLAVSFSDILVDLLAQLMEPVGLS